MEVGAVQGLSFIAEQHVRLKYWEGLLLALYFSYFPTFISVYFYKSYMYSVEKEENTDKESKWLLLLIFLCGR
jgi:hypothetical protein